MISVFAVWSRQPETSQVLETVVNRAHPTRTLRRRWMQVVDFYHSAQFGAYM